MNLRSHLPSFCLMQKGHYSSWSKHLIHTNLQYICRIRKRILTVCQINSIMLATIVNLVIVVE